jgi:ATP-dependent Clp protease protease subunit
MLINNPDMKLKEICVNSFTEKSAEEFRELVLAYTDLGPQTIIPIYIDSYGGNADALAKMIETMDSVPNRFMTICMGKAMSAAAILLSHGDVRWCGKYSRVMIHNVQSMVGGDLSEIRGGTQELERLNKVIIGLLAKNCGKSYDELQTIIKSQTDSKEILLDAQQAFEFGIVDHIGTPVFDTVIQYHLDAAPAKDKLSDEEKGIQRTRPTKKTTKKKNVTKKKKK